MTLKKTKPIKQKQKKKAEATVLQRDLGVKIQVTFNRN